MQNVTEICQCTALAPYSFHLVIHLRSTGQSCVVRMFSKMSAFFMAPWVCWFTAVRVHVVHPKLVNMNHPVHLIVGLHVYAMGYNPKVVLQVHRGGWPYL